jgi:hypothetical protein
MKDVLWTLLISVLGPFLACLAIWAAVRRPLGRYRSYLYSNRLDLGAVCVPSSERMVGQEVERSRAGDRRRVRLPRQERIGPSERAYALCGHCRFDLRNAPPHL